jgi:fucose 4-O-acetylase-like acetyltransferase
MWFLFSLIIWKVTLSYIANIKFAIPLSLLVSILAGYANDIGYFGSLSRTIVFFPFFLTGYFVNKHHLIRIRKKAFQIFSFIGVLTFLCFIYFHAEKIVPQWLYGSYSYDALGYHEWYAGIYRILIYLLTTILSLFILAIIPAKPFFKINELGSRSMYVYLLHGFVMKYLVYINIYQESPLEKLGLLVLGSFIAFILSLVVVKSATKMIVEPNLQQMFKG